MTRQKATRMFLPFQHRGFALYWCSMLLTSSGHWMELVAQGWLVVQLTDSPLLVGLVTGGQGIMQLLGGAPGGVIADLVNRKRLLQLSLAARGAIGLTLALLVGSGEVQLWHVAALAMVAGLVSSVLAPARHTFVYDLVGREHLTQAVAMNLTANNTVRVIGPAIAGFAIAFAGIDGVYAAIGAFWFLGAVAVTLIGVKLTQAGPQDRSVWGNLKEGVRYVRGQRTVMVLLAAELMTDAFAFSHRFLLPLFARDILLTDSVGLGVLFSASGVGALAGTALVGTLANEDNRGKLLTGALLGFGAALVLFSTSAWFPLSCLFLLCAGAMGNAFDSLTASSLQMMVDDAYRGRVMGLYVLTWGMSPLGGALAGAIASLLSVPFAIGFGGAMVVVTALVMVRAAPEVIGGRFAREAVRVVG